MAKSINFLSKQHHKATEQEKQDKQWFRYSLIALGIAVGVVVLLLSVNGFFVWQINVTKDRSTDLERQVLSSAAIEQSAAILGKKVSIIEKLFQQRQGKQQAIEYFSNLFGQSIVIKEINYQQTEGLLALRIQAPSIFDLERAFSLVGSDQTKELYGSVATSELRRDQAGFYTLNITITLTNNG